MGNLLITIRPLCRQNRPPEVLRPAKARRHRVPRCFAGTEPRPQEGSEEEGSECDGLLTDEGKAVSGGFDYCVGVRLAVYFLQTNDVCIRCQQRS